MNLSFPVILLFWALSLSPVWLNIEGRQDFNYKTQILFFYSENNSNSLNRPLNTNLIVVQCYPFLHSLVPLCCWGTLRHFFLQHFLQSEEKKHTLDVYKVEQFHKWTNYNVQITNVQLITFYCPIMEQKHVKKIVKPIRLQGREIPQRSKHCTKGLTPPLKKRKKCIYLFL